jgi:hypothetical protein
MDLNLSPAHEKLKNKRRALVPFIFTKNFLYLDLFAPLDLELDFDSDLDLDSDLLATNL